MCRRLGAACRDLDALLRQGCCARSLGAHDRDLALSLRWLGRQGCLLGLRSLRWRRWLRQVVLLRASKVDTNHLATWPRSRRLRWVSDILLDADDLLWDRELLVVSTLRGRFLLWLARHRLADRDHARGWRACLLLTWHGLSLGQLVRVRRGPFLRVEYVESDRRRRRLARRCVLVQTRLLWSRLADLRVLGRRWLTADGDLRLCLLGLSSDLDGLRRLGRVRRLARRRLVLILRREAADRDRIRAWHQGVRRCSHLEADQTLLLGWRHFVHLRVLGLR